MRCRLYRTKEHVDLYIVCKGREWKAHKVVVCSQSEYFQRQCSGEFKVHIMTRGYEDPQVAYLMMQEAKENTIDLSDDDPQAVDAMLYYLYNWDYHDQGNDQQQVSPIVLDVRVFAIADKFFVEPLKQLSADKFAKRAEAEWTMPNFAMAIAEVYDIIPEHEDTLEQMVVRVVKDHAGDLFDETKRYGHFTKVIRERAELAADVSEALATDIGQRYGVFKNSALYRCPGNGEEFMVRFKEGTHFNNVTCPCASYSSTLSWWAHYCVS